MSTPTIEKTAIAAGEPRSLVDVMIDAAALVGRIGQDRVHEMHVHVHDVIVTLAVGVDAWVVADELGLHGRDLAEDAGANELLRTAWGHHVVPGLSYVALHGDAMPGDVEDYDEQTGRSGAGAGLRVVGPNA